MIIKSIHLQNYRRYADQLLEFPNGLIGIVGKNGAGKSTLIEAIGWCLYGNNAARTGKDEIKRTSANPRDDCKVTLELVLDGDSLRIERELRGSNSTGMARLFVNGNSNAHVSGVAEVSNFIAKRTGMDYVAFFTSIFAKQKELNALSDLQPGERKKTVMRLLRIDKIDTVISNIRGDMRSSKDKIAFIKPTLKDLDGLLNEGIKLEKEKGEKKSEITNAGTEIVILKKSVKTEKSNFSLQEKKYRQFNKINSVVGNLLGKKEGKESGRTTAEGDLAGAKRSRDALEKIQPQVAEYESIKKEKEILDALHVKHNNKQSLEMQITQVNSRISAGIEEIQRINTQIRTYKNLDKDFQKNSRTLVSLQRKKESLEASINQLKSKIKGQESLKKKAKDEFSRIQGLGEKSKCPTCKRPLGEHLDTITKHFQDEIKKIEEIITNANTSKSNFSNDLKDVTSKMKDARDLESGMRDKKDTRTKLLSALKNETKNLNTHRKDQKSLKLKLAKFTGLNYDKARHDKVKADFSRLAKIKNTALGLQKDVGRIPVLISRISNLNKTIEVLESGITAGNLKIKKINFDKNEYDVAKRLLDSANRKYQSKREEMIELRGEFKQIITNIQQNKNDIIEEKGKRKVLEEEETKISSRSNLDRIMNDFKIDLISRIRPMLSSRASELFREMTNGKYPGLELDEDYNIKIEAEGMSFGVKRFSGGEEDLANLCLRIAISKELSERAGGSESNFIALDEIFGSQDAERKSNILKALSELSNQFRQILVITHIEDVRESLPYVFNVKENQDDTVKIETEGIPLTA